MKSVIAVGLCVVLALGACQAVTAPQVEEERAAPASSLFDQGALTVMTRGLGPGPDLERVWAASSASQVPGRTAEMLARLEQEDVVARARLLADEIQYARPHLIGLQQVVQVRLQSPGDTIFGGTEPARALALDVLSILQAELETRGLHYREVARVRNADVELPLLASSGASIDDARVTDFDVILARKDVDVSGRRTGNFRARREVGWPGFAPLPLPRGWASVVATVEGRRYRFVSTHLETAGEDGMHVQRAQAEELLRSLHGEPLPVVLVGDFNTPANLGLVGAPTYGALLLAGYVDVWTHRRVDGLDAEGMLPLELLAFEERRDLVLVRHPVMPGTSRVGPVRAYALENTRQARGFGPWRSERAGLVARLRVPSPPRN